MLTITTHEFIKFVRMFAGPSKCAIIFNDHDVEVRYGKKVNSIRYADSLGSLLDKDAAFKIINNVRYRFQ